MSFIHIRILNSYVNLNQNQSCQPSNFLCQQQVSTVMSISKFNSLVNIPFKFKLLQLCQSDSILFRIQFVSVNGQVASSHPRTACAGQFVSVIGQAASSHPRTASTYPLDTRRATSSGPRTARAFYVVPCQPSN